MVNLQSPIERTTISGIAELLSIKKENVSALSQEFIGNHQDNGKQIFIKLKEQSNFNTVVIAYTLSTATSITLYGKFNLSIPEVIGIYNTFRKVYVAYDDNYEFFFNEDKQKGDYALRVFIGREEYNKTDQSNIAHMQLLW